jgi:hypothetical protein
MGDEPLEGLESGSKRVTKEKAQTRQSRSAPRDQRRSLIHHIQWRRKQKLDTDTWSPEEQDQAQCQAPMPPGTVPSDLGIDAQL